MGAFEQGLPSLVFRYFCAYCSGGRLEVHWEMVAGVCQESSVLY